MTVQLPQGISENDEMEILFERTKKRTQVIVSLSGVKITIKIPTDSEHIAAALLSMLPMALDTAYEHMDNPQEDK